MEIKLEDISLESIQAAQVLTPNTQFDPKNHYEFCSHQHTLARSSNLKDMENAFADSASHEKHIWHVVGEKRILIKKEIK